MPKSPQNDAASAEAPLPPRLANIRDVGRAAGVSYQTVSRVINGSPNVSATTRQAVLAAIAELGFRPNRAARTLAGGPMQSVTVLATSTMNYGFAATIQGIEQAAGDAGFGMGVRTIDGRRPDDVERTVNQAIELSDALIIIAFDKAGVLALNQVPPTVPLVAAIQAPAPGKAPPRPSVWIDERAAAEEATRHLLALGHRTVHHIALPAWPSTTPRLLGWRAALKAAGVPAPRVSGSGFTPEWGYEAGRRLARRADVTAVLCGNDEIALGLYHALREAGREVPAEMSVIGFDDVPHARFFAPPLTTVRQDFVALGRSSFNLLRRETRFNATPIVSPEAVLIHRDSTAPPPPQRTEPLGRASRAGTSNGATRRSAQDSDSAWPAQISNQGEEGQS